MIAAYLAAFVGGLSGALVGFYLFIKWAAPFAEGDE